MTHAVAHYQFFFSHNSLGPLSAAATQLLKVVKRNKGGNVGTGNRLQFLFNHCCGTVTIRI